MTFLLIIIVLIVFFAENNRIHSLERRIRALESPVQKATPTTSSTHAGEAKPSSDAAHAAAMPLPSQAAAAPVRAQNPAHVESAAKESSEEASGRLLGRIGIAALLVGVAFFLKYAFDNNLIGPAGRVMVGVVIGVGIIALGLYLRKKYLRYGDLLVGGGAAVLYLTVYSAHSFYGFIGSFTAGLFMCAVTLFIFAISVVNATVTLATIGIIGGFVTPYLSGAHENNMLGLFGYITLLNLCVLAISYYKKWPRLNAIAFVGTIINFIGWFSAYYSRDVLSETLTFLFVNFLIFLAANIIRAIKTGTNAESTDYFLLNFNALWLAITGYIILEPSYHGMLGFAAVLVALVYMMVAFIANKYNPQDTALNIFLPGLAVVFLSIAVPLQFDGQWVAAGWLIESVLLYFIASQISNRGFQVMGLIVYILGVWNFFAENLSRFSVRGDFVPIFNSQFAILALAVLAAYTISWMYTKYGSITTVIRDRGIVAFVIIANVLTLYALTTQVTGYYSAQIVRAQTVYSGNSGSQSRYSDSYNNTSYLAYNAEQTSLVNQSNTAVSILWALYAALLTAVGFAKRLVSARRFGLVLFVVTGLKVLFDVWSLGELYRVISFIVFGVIALAASFAYAKYKDRLKQIV